MSDLPLVKPGDDDVEKALAIARRLGWLTDEGWIWELESDDVDTGGTDGS